MSNTRKKLCSVLNYIEHLLNLASGGTDCVSICAITSGIKKYKSIIRKKKKKHDKIVLLTKT